MQRSLSFVLVPLLVAGSASAQTVPPATASVAPAATISAAPDFGSRALELPALLRGEIAYDAFFSAGFRQAIPQDKFVALTAQIGGAAGKAVSLEDMTMTGPRTGQVRLRFERAIVTMAMTVDPDSPHLVTRLSITGLSAAEKSVDEVLSAISRLPGNTGFALARLDGDQLRFVHLQGADRAMAIGSEFKLVILAELVRALTAGERHWDDMITLDGRALPPGGYMAKPAGTRISLRELATQMISISDNSATDILIATLGRAKIEKMLSVVGIADPTGMRPFLTTLDAFKLKSLAAAGKIDWAKMAEAARRKALDGDLGKADVAIVSAAPAGVRAPRFIDTIEWFASPADMVRVMDWLRRHTESGPAADARAILAKNPGIGPAAAGGWNYVGFKGGSEPGVIALAFLLQAKDGSWWAASGSWNDATHEIDGLRFASLIGRAIELAKPHG
ncbi:MAG: hypothetical protein JWL96_698 [Sphingomonas bacterium]|nr:hypothetical protein [Sphingomonas bacterium]